jgi:hypothetical protein
VRAPFLLCFSLLVASVAVADEPARLTVGGSTQVSAGAQMSWYQCPCFRWVIQLQAGGAAIETREFLVSSEALFKFRQEEVFDAQLSASKIFNIGAAEVLWKGGHLGLGFEGITWGEDLDRGYTDVLKTGFYALASWVRTQSLRLDVRGGYQFQKMDVNQVAEQRGVLNATPVLRWRTENWSGNVVAKAGMDPLHLPGADTWVGGASAGVRGRLFDLSSMELGLGFQLSYEYDGWRNRMGAEPSLASAILLLDLSFVAGEIQSP